MRYWSLTLHGPSGIVHTLETGETEFVLGAETGPDVFSVTGEGVAARHAWVSISGAGVQVEDLAGGTLANGSPIEGRVWVDTPAAIQIGSVTIVIEVKNVSLQEQPASAEAQNLDVTAGSGLDIETTMAFGMEMQGAVTGQVFDVGTRYIKQEEIGRGGMARIVSARDAHLERLVAVKVSAAGAGDGDAQFLREADVLAKLAHPNIVPIHTRGTDELGRPFYSMKLVQGRTLQAIIKQLAAGDTATLREYSDQRLLEIFRKVCDGVEFAHSKGYLHRDLKPENVMVGEFGEVLVMDWGLAKAFRSGPAAGANDAQVDEPEKLSYIEGTPQYMSPEQAEGMYGGLDERSDIYSLGAILYAMLAKAAPVSGGTLEELIGKVRAGQITPFEEASSKESAGKRALGVQRALQAVTLKAMAVHRVKRHQSVRALIADIEAYQGGFLTSAEESSFSRQIRLWVGRNRVMAVSALLILLVITASTARVIQKGREASAALRSLRETAPTFAIRARDALEDGEFEAALTAATFAVKLEPGNAEFHALRGNVLQVLVRWREAVAEYHAALRIGDDPSVNENLALTKRLILQESSEGDAKAKGALFEALNAQGRRYQAMAFGRGLGDFWKDQKKDLSAIPELVERLQAKMLPVPGTGILLSKTEFTVGEWKLYLRAEGLPDWMQPSKDFKQDDEHPLILVRWNEVKMFCEWLSEKTGKEWRLPTNAEWEAAVGATKYPWGDDYPPHWDDGNYAIGIDGKSDPNKVGVDGIMGTAPVASFKANTLGFYDLGGNVSEWMWDGLDEKTGKRVIRGGNWVDWTGNCTVANRSYYDPGSRYYYFGFRVAVSSVH
jgi:serine/threonine protein kinase